MQTRKLSLFRRDLQELARDLLGGLLLFYVDDSGVMFRGDNRILASENLTYLSVKTHQVIAY